MIETIKGNFNNKTNEYSFKTDKFSTYAIAYVDENIGLEVETANNKKILTKKNEILELKVRVTPTEANQNVTYSSNNNKVVTVDETGKVTAVSNGTAIISVKTEDGSILKKITVTVKISSPIPTREQIAAN